MRGVGAGGGRRDRQYEDLDLLEVKPHYQKQKEEGLRCRYNPTQADLKYADLNAYSAMSCSKGPLFEAK